MTVERGVESREQASYSDLIADFFLVSKKGPYLDPEFLVQVTSDTKQTQSIRADALGSLTYIEKYGDDAMEHLCLPAYAYHRFRRAGVERLSEVRAWIEGSDLRYVHTFGKKCRDVTIDRLARFDAELAKQEAQSVE